jgi:hypothetical protein
VANFDTILPSVIEHFVQQIAKVAPIGKGMHRFKRRDAEQMLIDEGSRDRLFDVFVSEDVPPERFVTSATAIDWNVTINIDICYHVTRRQTAIAARDFDKIQRAITNSDTSSLTGYNFPYWQGYEWIPEADENENYRFIRIPVLCRITTTP